MHVTLEPSDQAVLQACRRGEEPAWELLIRRYQRLVYSVPRRAGLDEDAAADVFQKVFAGLFEQLDSLQQPDRVAAWLVTFARRETWRLIRQASATRAATEPEAAADAVADSDPLAEDVLVSMEEQDALARAVEALDPRCRELVRLLFYAADPPLPYAEIAVQLGIAEGSIGPFRGRCLERLRHALAKTAPGVFSARWPALSGDRS